jgi:transcriptional regulator
MNAVSNENVDQGVLRDLVMGNPLAWLVSLNLLDATLLPLMPILDEQGNIVAIEGHMSRANPHVKTLEAEKVATILFKGPDSYIPTTWVENKKLAPTWMLSSAAFRVNVKLLPSDADTQEHLKRLAAFMEKRSGSSWGVESMGERFAMLSAKVRAAVLSVKPSFKLGQNEPPNVLREMVSGLDKENKTDIAAWMKRANDRIDW